MFDGPENDNNEQDKNSAGREFLKANAASNNEDSDDNNITDSSISKNKIGPSLSDEHTNSSITGYYKASKGKLAYGGMFYSDDMEIMYRGATIPEIRHWSTMDTENEFDVMEHFSLLLKSCLKVVGGSWKDILEVDRFQLVLLIQDVTFIEKHNPVMLAFDCFDCDTANRSQLKPSLIKPKPIDMSIVNKYFDKELLSLNLVTKDLGNILYRPSTLGTSEAVYNFLKTKKPAYVKNNRSIIVILPRLMKSFRNVKNSDIDNLMTQWHSWNDTKISFIDTISKRVDFTTEETATLSCANCSTENQINVDPEGDVKYMFLRSDTLDEQLC